MNLAFQHLPPAIHDLRAKFVEEGEDLRAVGGCVRDMLLGVHPKDFDFATTADPLKQVAIYVKHGVRHIPTGEKHGTYTVRIDGQSYEITSLRTETEHDGRHAKVQYTRDWLEDLGRRDLTINAMALDMDGVLHDPFGGKADLEARRVRFVGNPVERMREDYLRILRFLRFHARFAGAAQPDQEAADAIESVGHNLDRISAERVWSEISRMIAQGAVGVRGLAFMGRLRILHPCGLLVGSQTEAEAVAERTRNPVTIMVAYIRDEKLVERQAKKWKWSLAERDLATFLAYHLPNYALDRAGFLRLLADDEKPRDWVRELALLMGYSALADEIETYDIPVFPVRGQDLLDLGMPPGPAIGLALDTLRNEWATHGYAPTREKLLDIVRQQRQAA